MKQSAEELIVRIQSGHYVFKPVKATIAGEGEIAGYAFSHHSSELVALIEADRREEREEAADRAEEYLNKIKHTRAEFVDGLRDAILGQF
jgi:hypothetical protein